MAAVKIFKLVILGAPASGKGTISQRIVRTFNLKHISSGDLLRQHIKNNTAIGKEAKKYIKDGKLVPDEVMIKFIMCEIEDIEEQSWLLDGFPRTLSQAKALWGIEKLDLVINLLVPYQAIIDRVKGRWVHLPSGRVYNVGFNAPKAPGIDDVTGEPLVQREDDKPDVVLKRLEQYEKMTGPVNQFYREKGILKEFCGDKTDVIWPLVLEHLCTFMPLHFTAERPRPC